MNKRELRGIGIWLLAASQLALTSGCRQLGSGYSGNGASSTAVAASTSGPDIGQILYNMLLTNVQKSGTPAEVAALQADQTEFVTAVDEILPSSVSNNLLPTLEKLLPLVSNGTIPNGMADIQTVMQDMLANPNVIAAIADLQQNASVSLPIDANYALLLLSRALSNSNFSQLATATNDLLTTDPQVLTIGQSLLSQTLEGLTPSSFTSSPVNLQGLASALLSPVDVSGLGNLGAPAYAVQLDVNGNPAVAINPATNQVYAPFVDNGSGVASVNTSGQPIDVNGNVVSIAPIGSTGSRDSYGRALAPDGNPLFVYFDAKHTLLAVILILAGNLVAQNVPQDLLAVINAISTPVQNTGASGTYTGFSSSSPVVEIMDSGVELLRRTPVPQLLQGLALMVQQNPTQFQTTVTDLVVGINLAEKSGFSSAGTSQMFNQLLPLLSQAAAQTGNGTSALRALLGSFNTAQAQLQNLPAGFALMMQYNNYGTKTLTGPGLPSEMSQLLNIMNDSNQCSPIILGNLADLYINTMAGNGPSILGFSLSISTMNSLLGIGPLRSLLCSGLNASDVGVLQDFVDTGSLAAFTPIAKAFSDQGETQLLVNIMLALQANYATAMAPNEPAIIKLLNSGAVDQLFDAINQMSTITVPSNNETLINVLADVLTDLLITQSTPIVDSQGRSFTTLAQYAMQPFSDLSTAATAANCQSTLTSMMSAAEGLLLSTYTDASGNQQMVYGGLVSTLGQTLTYVSQQLPTTTATLDTWCTNEETTIANLFSSQAFYEISEILNLVNTSPDASTFTAAIAGIFIPNTDPTQDCSGALLQLAAAFIQAKPGPVTPAQSADDLATIMNFVGEEIDPAAGKLNDLMTMLMQIMAVDNGQLVLNLVLNAINEGPNGTQTPPILALVSVYNDYAAAAAQSATAQGGTQGITNFLNEALAFMQNQQTGLPHIFATLDTISSNP
jgi:hypothetical protein